MFVLISNESERIGSCSIRKSQFTRLHFWHFTHCKVLTAVNVKRGHSTWYHEVEAKWRTSTRIVYPSNDTLSYVGNHLPRNYIHSLVAPSFDFIRISFLTRYAGKLFFVPVHSHSKLTFIWKSAARFSRESCMWQRYFSFRNILLIVDFHFFYFNQ